MGNDIALVAIVIVGGIIAYKYLPTLLKSAGTTTTDVATPTAKNDTASQAPVPQTVIQQAINQIVVNQTNNVNNTKFVNDFDIKVGKSRKKSKENIQLLIAFNPDRYHHSSHYRRYVNIIINHLPMSYERDYWQNLIERQFSDIDDNDDDGGQRFLGPPVRRGKPCVQTEMCMTGERWDSKRCKCVPRPSSSSGGEEGGRGDCVQTVMCAMNTHWDINKCKCVPNSLPTPNINVDSVTGQKIVVDGASSSYSRSTLVNNLRHISYY